MNETVSETVSGSVSEPMSQSVGKLVHQQPESMSQCGNQ